MRAVKDLVTCRYCGIVPRGHQCKHKTSRQKSGDRQSDRFRKTKAWTDKSIEIRQKSKYLCAVCMEGTHHTMNWLNYKNLEVHHIYSLAEDYSKRLDNGNLICLCQFHHKMAEQGEISREELLELVKRRDADENSM